MNIPNYLSVLRIVLVAFFVTLLLYATPGREHLLTWALWVLIAACLTDALDGYLARKLDQKTVLGSYIDPIADKLLLISGFLSLSFMPHLPAAVRLPAWVTIPVITRDVVILIGSLMIFVTTGRLTASPLMIGKVTTFFQMGTLVASLAQIAPELKIGLSYATVLLTVLSGFGYLKMGARIFQPTS